MKSFSLLFVVSAFLILTCHAQAKGLVLCQDGRTSYRIVIADSPSPSEKYAAQELQRFLQQMTDTQFPVSSDRTPLQAREIVIGYNRHLEQTGLNVDKAALRDEGYLIRTEKDWLIIAGSSVRGALYGVYGFLEDHLGCRWYTPDCHVIPKRPSIELDQIIDQQIPAFIYREIWAGLGGADQAVRNRVNGEILDYQGVKPKHGGRTPYAPSGVHTFLKYVPPKKYFGSHPEYFSEINGKRVKGRTQLCLTNPDVLELVIQELGRRIKAQPTKKVWDVSQADWGGFCECPQCRKITEQEGALSGALIHFVNKVADAITQDHPDLLITTLAYRKTRKPPRHVRPRDNVVIRLCTIEACFSRPLASDPRNAAFRQDIQGWSRISKRLYVWDYVTNFWHYLMPHPNLQVLGPNVRFFRDHNVIGLMAQGNSRSSGGEFNELRCWVLAKLLWNPDRDAAALIQEFVSAYYGPAAPYIMQYIDALHDSCEKAGTFLKYKTSLSASFLNAPFLLKADTLFKAAERTVRDDQKLLKRVRLARLPIDYVFACRYWDLRDEADSLALVWTGPATYREAAGRFKENALANHVSEVGEGRKTGSLLEELKFERKRSPRPKPFADTSKRDFIDIQDNHFLPSGSLYTRVEDRKASDGVAARMVGDKYAWGVQHWLRYPQIQENPGTQYDIYAVVRCELTGTKGRAFMLGIYDAANKRRVLQRVVKAADVPDDNYHIYYAGRAAVTSDMWVWAANPNNGANVKFVYVDRFFLVKASAMLGRKPLKTIPSASYEE